MVARHIVCSGAGLWKKSAMCDCQCIPYGTIEVFSMLLNGGEAYKEFDIILFDVLDIGYLHVTVACFR